MVLAMLLQTHSLLLMSLFYWRAKLGTELHIRSQKHRVDSSYFPQTTNYPLENTAQYAVKHSSVQKLMNDAQLAAYKDT